MARLGRRSPVAKSTAQSRGRFPTVSHMTNSESAPAKARVALPPWLWGSDPRGYLREAQLRGRRSEIDPEVWEIQTEEGYARRQPLFVTLRPVAGPPLSRPRTDSLLGGEEPTFSE